MKTHPLEQLDLPAAKTLQFRLVETIASHFSGDAMLEAGDYGVQPDTGRPHFTARVEAVLAEFFGAESACLVRGAGTGALRSVLMAALKPGQRLLVHGAPIYPTTVVTIEAMGLGLVHVDFNDLGALRTVQPGETPCVLVQHARQRLEDRYSLADVIRELKARDPDLVVVVDDNYAAMRVARIGIQLGADVSAFSLFKLHGPEGVGCVVGREGLLDRIRKQNCSGGTQVQGVEAMEALRALTSVPVEMAVQAEVVEEVAARLNSGEVGGVAHAYVANAQSRVVLVELRRPCASQVLEKSALYGAACRPVGAESRYEILPLFYSVSRTFRQENPELADTTIRINPMRAGSDLVIGILAQAIRDSEGS